MTATGQAGTGPQSVLAGQAGRVLGRGRDFVDATGFRVAHQRGSNLHDAPAVGGDLMIVDQHHDGGGDAIVHMLGAFRATPVGDLARTA